MIFSRPEGARETNDWDLEGERPGCQETGRGQLTTAVNVKQRGRPWEVGQVQGFAMGRTPQSFTPS